jgi:hypothetical protein
MSTAIEDTEQVLVDMSHELQALESQVKYLMEQLKWAKRRQDTMSKDLLGTMARLNKLEQWQIAMEPKAVQ